jgi:very-short-patch-repair endonuclease
MYGYDFHRQKPIRSYIVDFFCYKLRLVIECDGYSHELMEVWQKDSKKTWVLNQMGIHVLRFSDYQVMRELDNVLWCIEGYIIDFEEKGYTPPSVPPF